MSLLAAQLQLLTLFVVCTGSLCLYLHCRFITYQDARRVRLVDGLIFETNILRVSPVNIYTTSLYSTRHVRSLGHVRQKYGHFSISTPGVCSKFVRDTVSASVRAMSLRHWLMVRVMKTVRFINLN